jgi:hypothetical protein
MSFERVSRHVDSLLLRNFSVFRLLVEITAVHLRRGFTCAGVKEKRLRCCCWKLFELVRFDVVMFALILLVYLTIVSMYLVTMAPRVLRMRTEGLPVDG